MAEGESRRDRTAVPIRHVRAGAKGRGVMINAIARVAPEKADFRPALLSRPNAGVSPERAMATYWEKLRDPRWQKRRLQIMEAVQFSCQDCGDDKATLNVHHKIYRKGANPWEYRDDELECLCERCHEEKHRQRAALNQILATSDFPIDDLVALIAGFLDANACADPMATEMGRQMAPLFYEIGAAASAVQHEVFRLTSRNPARKLLHLAFSGGPQTPAVKRILDEFEREEGNDH